VEERGERRRGEREREEKLIFFVGREREREGQTRKRERESQSSPPFIPLEQLTSERERKKNHHAHRGHCPSSIGLSRCFPMPYHAM